ncbi:hypothetical protein OAB57_02160 [Bacteriovoracaceae bacterium]|nr:hypothetical protein [Bacteriovoracaceae bacterium]
MASEALADQGFSENELADIMDEIEGLESEFLEDSGEVKDAAVEGREAETAEAVADPEKGVTQTIDTSDEESVVQDSAVADTEQEENAMQSSFEDDLSEVEESEAVDENAFEQNASDLGEMEEEAAAESDDEDSSEFIQELSDGLGINEEPTTNMESLKSDSANKTQIQSQVDDVLLSRDKDDTKLAIVKNTEDHHESNVGTSAEHSKMELSVSGSLDITLNFLVADQKVNLRVDRNEGLIIELDGGARFCVPIK